MNKRLNWLDVGKGLGMILVMLGHTNIPSPLKAFIYTFHMPLFFFLSGYLFSVGKYPNFKFFLSKKISSLLVPYLFFSILAYVWFIITFKSGLVHYHDNLLKPLFGTIVAIRNSEWTIHSGTLWFLVCLFCTELIFYIITRKFHTHKSIAIVLLFTSIMGYLYNKLVGIPLPWSLDITMISVSFYGIGYLCKENISRLECFVNIKSFIVLGIINIISGLLNVILSGERTDMFYGNYGNYFLFFIAALTGISAFIIFTKLIKNIALFQYVGRNSLIYLALHQTIIFTLLDIVTNKYFVNAKFLEVPMLKGLLYTVITLILIVPIIYVVNNHLPFILGKNKKFKKNQVNIGV